MLVFFITVLKHKKQQTLPNSVTLDFGARIRLKILFKYKSVLCVEKHQSLNPIDQYYQVCPCTSCYMVHWEVAVRFSIFVTEQSTRTTFTEGYDLFNLNTEDKFVTPFIAEHCVLVRQWTTIRSHETRRRGN